MNGSDGSCSWLIDLGLEVPPCTSVSSFVGTVVRTPHPLGHTDSGENHLNKLGYKDVSVTGLGQA